MRGPANRQGLESAVPNRVPRMNMTTSYAALRRVYPGTAAPPLRQRRSDYESLSSQPVSGQPACLRDLLQGPDGARGRCLSHQQSAWWHGYEWRIARRIQPCGEKLVRIYQGGQSALHRGVANTTIDNARTLRCVSCRSTRYATRSSWSRSDPDIQRKRQATMLMEDGGNDPAGCASAFLRERAMIDCRAGTARRLRSRRGIAMTTEFGSIDLSTDPRSGAEDRWPPG